MLATSDDVFISASQIEAYVMCNRKWAFRSIEKLKAEPNKYAARGIDLHDVAENFLRDGTPPPTTDAGEVFKAGLPFLPAPGTGICEGPFKFRPEGEPFIFVGRIDWRSDSDGLALDLLDHKSTSSQNFAWTKSAEVLRTDVQAMLYSEYVMRLRNLEVLRGRWLSYRWTPNRPKAIPTDFTVPREHVAAQFAMIVEIAREMTSRVRAKPKARELPYDVTACDAFGGCPYFTECGLSPRERLRAHMAAQQTLKEKMEARKLQAPAVNPPAATAPVAQAAPAPVQASLPTPAPVQAAPAPVEAPVAEQAGGQVVPMQTMKQKMAARKAKEGPAEAAGDAQAAPAPAPATQAPAATVAAPAAATGRLSKGQCEDLALACEMIGHGFKSMAQHFRSL